MGVVCGCGYCCLIKIIFLQDKKFGFGGLKRDKRNTAQSSADMSMFRTGRRGSFDKGRGGKKSGPKPRPGKSSRQRMKKNKRH